MSQEERSDARILYLYCLIRSQGRIDLHEQAGIDNCSLTYCNIGGLDALISWVRSHTFCGHQADTRLRDPDWVGPLALRHQEIIQAAMEQGPVMPLPLATLFSTEAKLRQCVAANEQRVLQFLDQAEDREEWAVKIFVDQARVTEHLLSEKMNENRDFLEQMTPGRRYVEEKRLEKGIKGELGQCMSAIAQAVSNDLEDEQRPMRERPLLSSKAAGTEHPMLLNAALWVQSWQVPAFKERLSWLEERYAQYGLFIRASGPWPAYTFCPEILQEES